MTRSGCVVAMILATGCQLPAGRAPVRMPVPETAPQPTTTSVDIAALEQATIDAANGARRREGARALRGSDAMMRAARDHAVELATRRELDHASTTPERETFARRLALAGAPAWTLAGENLIQLPYITRDVPTEAVTGWLGSPSHRSQLLEPTYTDTGVGIARDTQGNWYLVQLFIRRR